MTKDGLSHLKSEVRPRGPLWKRCHINKPSTNKGFWLSKLHLENPACVCPTTLPKTLLSEEEVGSQVAAQPVPAKGWPRQRTSPRPVDEGVGTKPGKAAARDSQTLTLIPCVSRPPAQPTGVVSVYGWGSTAAGDFPKAALQPGLTEETKALLGCGASPPGRGGT